MQLQHVWQQPDYKFKTSYAELGQSRPCKFSFAIQEGDTLKIMNAPILCRDFFLDTIVWAKNEQGKVSKQVWGWNYAGEFAKDFTSLVINDYGNILENIKFLNAIEEKIGIMPTEVKEVGEGFVWTKGAAFWQLTTVHLSWYTHMLRLLTYPETLKTWDDFTRDNEWIDDESWEKFKVLPEVLVKLKVTQVCGAKLPVSSPTQLHDYSGWWSACRPERRRFTHYGEEIHGLLASRGVS